MLRNQSKEPWIIQFAKPALGIPSGNLVMPIGMGITSKNNEFLGIVTGGLNVNFLMDLIKSRLDTGLNFIIFNEQLVPALSNIYESKQESFYSSIDMIDKSEIEYNNANHNFFLSIQKRVPGYPYTILVGKNFSDFINHYVSLLSHYILILILMTAFILVVMHLVRKKTTNIIQLSDNAEEEFFNQVLEQLHSQVDIIVKNSRVMLKLIKGDIEVGIDKNKQAEMISNISEAANKLNNLTVNQNIMSIIDINQIIKKSVTVKYKKAVQKDISIITNLQDDLPILHINLMNLQQIIIGLISLSIETTPAGGSINITTTLDSSKDSVSIIIQDNGFAVDENDMVRIRTIFGKSNKANMIDLKLSDILSIIKGNNGYCNIKAELGLGRTVKVCFPLNNFKSTSESSNKIESNIYTIQQKI